MNRTPRTLRNAIGVLALLTAGVAVAFAVIAFGAGSGPALHQILNPIIPTGAADHILRLPSPRKSQPAGSGTAPAIGRGVARLNESVATLVGNRPSGSVPEFRSTTVASEPGDSGEGVRVAVNAPVRDRLEASGGDQPNPRPSDADNGPPSREQKRTEGTHETDDGPTNQESQDQGKSKPAKEHPAAGEPRNTTDDDSDDDSPGDEDPDTSHDGSAEGGGSSGGGGGDEKPEPDDQADAEADMSGDGPGGNDDADDSDGSGGDGDNAVLPESPCHGVEAAPEAALETGSVTTGQDPEAPGAEAAGPSDLHPIVDLADHPCDDGP